jgi:O-antigen ligase
MDPAAPDGGRISEMPEAPGVAPAGPAAATSVPQPLLIGLVALGAVAVALVLVGTTRPGAGWALAAGSVVGALALLGVARRSMEGFVLLVLVLRPSLDGLHAVGRSSWTDPATLLAIVFGGAGLFWLVARRLQGRRHPVSIVEVAIAAFLGGVALATLTSEEPRASAGQLARLAVAGLMFVVVARVCEDTGRPDRFLVAVLAAAAVPVTVALIGPAVGVDRVEMKDQIERVVSTFAQSNPFGHFLTIVVIVLAAYALIRPRRQRTLALVAAVPVALALALSYTRLAWVAAAVALLVMAWAAGRRWLVPIIAIALVAAALLSPSVADRLERLTDSNPGVAGSEPALGWRWDHWKDVYRLAADNPVTGVGPGVVERRVANHQPPHNDYLRAFVEYGAVGLVTYLGLLGSLVVTAIRARRVGEGSSARTVALAAVGVVTALVVTSVAANMLGQVVLLWYVFALVAAAGWVVRHQRVHGADMQVAGWP